MFDVPGLQQQPDHPVLNSGIMPLAPDYDGLPRNAAAHAEVLAETGQVNTYMAAERAGGMREEEVAVNSVAAARRFLAEQYGLRPTRPDQRPLALGTQHHDAYAGRK